MWFREFEITEQIEFKTDNSGEINLWAVEMGASGKTSTTHTITLRYTSNKARFNDEEIEDDEYYDELDNEDMDFSE